MNKKIITKEIDLNGRKLTVETGKLALQADASVVISWGETVILATVATQPQIEDLGYFPLSVEYVEKHYAGGRISSSRFVKRETRPTEEAVLTSRLIDRSIRPLFPKGFKDSVQVMLNVLSFDKENDLDVVGLIGASAALAISSIPWNGPIAGMRIGEKEGKLIVNPTIDELAEMNMDLLVASTKEKVVMIETQAKQVENKTVLEGIKEAHKESQKVIALIEEFAKEAGKEKQAVSRLDEDLEKALQTEVTKIIKEKIEAALFDNEHPWHEATGNKIKQELAIQYAETLTEKIISGIFDKVAKEILHETVLHKNKRVDGRAMDEVRSIHTEVGFLPRVHGSAVFNRGDTQVLSIVTLGAPSLRQTLDGMKGERTKRFMHYYNMAINPFSVGEVKKIFGPKRRDIGHGALAEKALVAVIPAEDKFPYAIRVVSEVLAANASTSMAAICATSAALLSAGVPILEPVAGVALGLFSEEGKFQVITDMRAVEDFYGEMDFKVAGTKNGVTAIQMDTKLEGLSFEIIDTALEMGQRTRLEILEKMGQVISQAVPLSPYAPRVEVLHIKPEEIGLLIGPGGKNINGIIAKTGSQIDIEDDGTVMVSGTDSKGVDAALGIIEDMFKVINVGDEFTGKVVRLAPFGAFVEITSGKDGLVHISQMAPGRVERAEDVVSEGQEVKVRVTDVTPEGKIGLSMLFGADIKPESENRPSGNSFRPRSGDFGRDSEKRRPFGDRSSKPRGFSDRPRSGGGERRGFGSEKRSGSFDRNRGGGRDRGGRGGFNR
ncbi:polyribonucleotide nucleotidyltransferase [Patescibacteria group bacterium]|nr:polyribonucleotide nucleotidyltransferase [Patescibacteria group bacterium]